MTRAASLEHGLSGRWWNAIDRRLNRSDLQAICKLILVTYLLALGVSFATQVTGRTAFGSQLGADFGAFYIAGTIFNTVSPDRIHDRELQRQLYREFFPDAPADEELPYVNAPFFVLPFPLLSRLPYAWAYLCWFAISLGLFVYGFTLLWRTLPGLPEEHYTVALLLALSFAPFLVECLAGGQTSAFGFFSLALGLSFDRRGREVLGGIAISLCAYKPTLLLLIVPMLIVTRRLKTLGGFLAGILLLAAVSLLAVGWQGCLGFIDTLLSFAGNSAVATSGLKSWKYVDVNSFSRLLFNGNAYLRWMLVGLTFLAVLPPLVRRWRQANREDDNQQCLVWAFTITWTLVSNVYLGIYDATLVVLGILLGAQVFYQQTKRDQVESGPVFKQLLLLLYLSPWVTQPVAKLTGIQIFTLVLALFGCFQFSLFSKLNAALKERHPGNLLRERESTP
jgi:hypothetical protein